MPHNHTNTLHLFDRARAGDREARRDLLERYRERIRRILSIRDEAGGGGGLPNRERLDDLLLGAFSALDQLQALDDASVVTALARHVEEAHRAAPSEAAGDAGAREGLPPLNARVDARLRSMPRENREVYLLRHFMGMSFVRIAQELGGLTPNQVRAIYLRVRADLVSSVAGEEGR